MNRMRLRIAERLKESQNAAASLTTFNEIDMSSLMDMRKKYKDQILKEHDVKLGFMSAFAKASCLALKEIPSANASIEVRLATSWSSPSFPPAAVVCLAAVSHVVDDRRLMVLTFSVGVLVV